MPTGLGTHYAPWQRSRWRRAMNRLASAQVTSEPVELDIIAMLVAAVFEDEDKLMLAAVERHDAEEVP